MGKRMTRAEFVAAFRPGKIDPQYRAGLRFAAMLSEALARDLVEHNGCPEDVAGPLHMLADIARHLGSHNEA